VENLSPGIDPPYQIYGGIYREEAIMLLRRFYVQENEKGELLLECVLGLSQKTN